jgi:Uma2 family endonuclease
MSAVSGEKLVLGPDLNGIVMRPEEFDAVEEYDDGYAYELIHGVLVVSPIPSEGEASPNDELGYMLRSYRDTHAKGKSLNETLPERYVKTADSRRRADRVIWAGLGRLPDPELDVPTIIAEFVSEGKQNYLRDYDLKRAEYIAIGVTEYWIIDRFRRTLTVCRADGSELLVPEKRVYRTPLLPGFVLNPARLFAVADQWTKPN